MRTPEHFAKHVGVLTLVSGLLALSCNILLGLAVRFNFDAFTAPSLIFDGLEEQQIEFFRWGMITDIWGYYLLFVPAVFFLVEKMETPWRPVIAASGVAYALMGAIGAAILAATGAHFLREYLHAADEFRQASKDNFLLVYHLVNNGIWNLLEMGLFGVFMLGAAPVLRPKNKVLYYLTVLLGGSGILDTVGHTFEIGILSDIGLNFYLFFEPIWAIWLGIRWMRRNALA
ncbi:MAG TPA: hypothetical protein PKE06_25725 [Flavilitoribacter sp.]|nr:hypothetical protein [Flavilitoribacter sp.]HMQ87603.1 hypothetical protein [Flavilitoribacter sp.]